MASLSLSQPSHHFRDFPNISPSFTASDGGEDVKVRFDGEIFVEWIKLRAKTDRLFRRLADAENWTTGNEKVAGIGLKFT